MFGKTEAALNVTEYYVPLWLVLGVYSEDVMGVRFKGMRFNATLQLVYTRILINHFVCSNPEQSKHLETATMRVKGVWLDFVNLRAETYAQNSRIPTMVPIICS